MVDLINFSFNDRRIVHQKNHLRMKRESNTQNPGKWLQLISLFLLFQWAQIAFRPIQANPLNEFRGKRSHFQIAKPTFIPEISETSKISGKFTIINF